MPSHPMAVAGPYPGDAVLVESRAGFGIWAACSGLSLLLAPPEGAAPGVSTTPRPWAAVCSPGGVCGILELFCDTEQPLESWGHWWWWQRGPCRARGPSHSSALQGARILWHEATLGCLSLRAAAWMSSLWGPAGLSTGRGINLGPCGALLAGKLSAASSAPVQEQPLPSTFL